MRHLDPRSFSDRSSLELPSRTIRSKSSRVTTFSLGEDSFDDRAFLEEMVDRISSAVPDNVEVAAAQQQPSLWIARADRRRASSSREMASCPGCRSPPRHRRIGASGQRSHCNWDNLQETSGQAVPVARGRVNIQGSSLKCCNPGPKGQSLRYRSRNVNLVILSTRNACSPGVGKSIVATPISGDILESPFFQVAPKNCTFFE